MVVLVAIAALKSFRGRQWPGALSRTELAGRSGQRGEKRPQAAAAVYAC
jgi:hypothetical protein